MSKVKTSAKEALFELFKQGVPLMSEGDPYKEAEDTFYMEQTYRIDLVPDALSKFFNEYGYNPLGEDYKDVVHEFMAQMPKSTLFTKIHFFCGHQYGVAIKGVHSLIENMKPLLSYDLSAGGDPKDIEESVEAYLGEEKWHLKNYENNHDKWLLIRNSDGLTYPVNLD